MKNFGLSYNLFDNEIKMLSHFLDRDENGYGEYEGDDGWLKDNESINIIEGQLNQMKENRNLSKKIILDVLNDKDEKYPMNVKLFYITNVGTVINEKNEFLYDRKEFLNYTTIIKDLLIDYINKNNFIYQDNSKDIMNSILRNNKVEDFAERLSKDIPMVDFLNSNEAFGKVVQDYINNNTKICIELYGAENIQKITGTQIIKYSEPNINKVENIEGNDKPNIYAEAIAKAEAETGNDTLKEDSAQIVSDMIKEGQENSTSDNDKGKDTPSTGNEGRD